MGKMARVLCQAILSTGHHRGQPCGARCRPGNTTCLRHVPRVPVPVAVAETGGVARALADEFARVRLREAVVFLDGSIDRLYDLAAAGLSVDECNLYFEAARQREVALYIAEGTLNDRTLSLAELDGVVEELSMVSVRTRTLIHTARNIGRNRVYQRQQMQRTVLPECTVEDCPVCFCENMKGRQFPCGHSLCQGCGDKWLPQNPTCPMCRAPAFSSV